MQNWTPGRVHFRFEHTNVSEASFSEVLDLSRLDYENCIELDVERRTLLLLL